MTQTLRRLRLAVLAAPLLLGACEQAITAKTGTVPARMEVLGGDAQTGDAGIELPTALTVRVVDGSGKPVPGASVNFRVTAGGGSVFAGSNVTNADGIARERWTLGPKPGEPQRLEARAVDNETGQAVVYGTFTATAVVGAPHLVTVSRGVTSPVSGLVGEEAVQITVRVTDRMGNPIPKLGVGWNPHVGGGSVTHRESMTDSDGRASTGWTLGPNVGIAQLLAIHPGELPFINVTGVAQVGPTSKVEIVGGNNQTMERGAPVPERLAVIVRAPDGRPIVGAPVYWGAGNCTSGNTPVTVLSPTNEQGRAEATAPPSTCVGTNVLYARAFSGAYVSAGFNMTVTQGTPTTLVLVGTASRTVTRGVANPLRVRVDNAYGYPVTAQTVSWSVDPSKGTLAVVTSPTTGTTVEASNTFTPAAGAVSPAIVTATWGTQQVQFTLNF